MARLENWILHNYIDDDGYHREYLTGNVFGHPKADLTNDMLTDGHMIKTNNLVVLDLVDNIAITTSGILYELYSK